MASEDDYAAAYFGGKRRGDRKMDLALKLLGLMQGEEETSRESTFRERQQRALELQQAGQLTSSQEATKLAREQFEEGKKEKERAETRGTTEKIQARMDAADKAALELKKTELDEAYRQKNLAISGIKELATGDRPILSEDIARARLAEIYPEYSDIFRAEGEKKIATGVEQNLEKFKAMTPKGRAEAAKTKAGIESLGGPDVYKRLVEQIANEPAPPPEPPGLLSRIFGGSTPTAPSSGTTPVQGSVAGRRGYGTVPGQETGGKPLTEIIGLQDPFRYVRQQPPPVTPQPTEFEYQEGYPSAKPDYMYPEDVRAAISSVEHPESVRSRIEADPRYQSAESQLLQGAMDWWNKKAPIESAPGPPVAGSVQPPQPGFLESILRRLNDASTTERASANPFG